MIRGKAHLTQVWMSHPPRPSFILLTSLLPCVARPSQAVCPVMPLGFQGLCHVCPILRLWVDHQTCGIAKQCPGDAARVSTQGSGQPSAPALLSAAPGSAPGRGRRVWHHLSSFRNSPVLCSFFCSANLTKLKSYRQEQHYRIALYSEEGTRVLATGACYPSSQQMQNIHSSSLE